MKAKRWISLLLAVSMMLGVLAMPALAATQQPESTAVVSEELPDAAALSAAEDENDIVNIRIRATGNLVYGSDYKLEVETRPENTQYIAVVLGTSGEAYGYVTLMISDKLRTLLKLANPFAPHVTEEIWSVMNFGGQISGQSWPTYDPAKCVDSMVEIAVQLAGKIKARIMVPTDITAADAIAAAKADPAMAPLLEGKTIIKEIYVPGKLVNIVAKG